MAAGGLAAFPGATAPDWLEIAHAKRTLQNTWKRSSLIPHRTITHWWPLWLIALVAAWFWLHNATNTVNTAIAVAILGFSLGGITHLLCDVPDPTGIPIAYPTESSRRSLYWWKSGSPWEWIQVAAFAMLTAGIVVF